MMGIKVLKGAKELLKVSFAGLILILVGCATVSDEVSLAKISPRQRVYVGQFQVSLNGVENPKCEIYLNLDITPSLTLAPDGLVVFKTDRNELKFRRIACYDKMGARLAAWHHQDLGLSAIQKPEKPSDMIYFGKIKIDWRVDRELAERAANQVNDPTSVVKVAQMKDSGELSVQIESDPTNIETILAERVPTYKNHGLELVEKLVTKK